MLEFKFVFFLSVEVTTKVIGRTANVTDSGSSVAESGCTGESGRKASKVRFNSYLS